MKPKFERRDFLQMAGAAAMFSTLTSPSAVEAATSNDIEWMPHPVVPHLEFNMLWKEVPQPETGASCLLIRLQKEFNVDRHAHDTGELIYMIHGSFSIKSRFPKSHNPFTNDVVETSYKKGDTIWIPPGTIHETETILEDNSIALVFLPDPSNYNISPI